MKKTFETNGSLDCNFDNDRFLKLRLKVLHDGLNLNDTFLTSETIDNSKESIKNVPILANVIKDEDGNFSFGSHDMSIETSEYDDTQLKMIYQEVPIGVVPESCNYSTEFIDGKEYVFVDGYVWKGYCNYAQELIEERKYINLSMEIDVQDYVEKKFENSEDEYFEITSYKYTGITLLGDNVEPAMLGACAINTNFSATSSETFKELSNELNTLLNNKKVGENMENIETTETISVEEITQDVIDTTTENETISVTVEDTSTQENFSENLEADDKSVGDISVVADVSADSEIIETQDVIVFEQGSTSVIFDKVENKYFKVVCSITGDTKEEVFVEFYTQSELDELEKMKNTFSCYEQELQELREYKNKIVAEAIMKEKQKVYSKWFDKLQGIEEYQKLEVALGTLSKEEIEIQCKCIYADFCLQRENFSANKQVVKEKKLDTTSVELNYSLNKGVYPIVNENDEFIQRYLKK